MKKIVLTGFTLLLFAFNLGAQDSWHPDVRWRVIDGDLFDVIYPEALENEARKAAASLDTLSAELSETLGIERMRRWKLILWYENAYSNGYVTIAPRYSLWNSGIDSSSFYEGDWLTMMASHEGRHMAQFDRLASGGGFLFWLLFGDMGTAYLSSFCLPPWLFEGDAVLSETLLTDYGRGRSSDFALKMKSQLLQGELKYSQAVNGSYRSVLPNWYEYGYFLTAYIRKYYGPGAVEKIFSTAGVVPVPMFGQSVGIRAATGKWPAALFRDMCYELTVLFQEQVDEIDETPAEFLDAAGENEYCVFSNPVLLDDGTVGALRTGLDGRKKFNIYTPDGGLYKSFNFDFYTGEGIASSGNAASGNLYFTGFSRIPGGPGGGTEISSRWI